MPKDSQSKTKAQVAGGIVAGPMFVLAFTAIGARRQGYDWHRHAVSSLAAGDRGWQQRANFIVAGVLYSSAALGLGRCSRQSVAPHIVPSLVAGVGVGLIGSGVFVTDPVSGFPRTRGKHGSGKSSPAEITLSREGKLHNICAIPIFAGIPVAGLASALVAARRREYHWACLSAGSSLAMVGSFLLFGAAFGHESRLAGKGGVFQRISVASGFGWLTVLSLRALSSLRRSQRD